MNSTTVVSVVYPLHLSNINSFFTDKLACAVVHTEGLGIARRRENRGAELYTYTGME